MHKHHHRHHHDEEWDASDARFGGPQGEPGWGPPPGYGWGGRPFPPPGAFRGGFGPWAFRGRRGFGPWMFRGGHGFGPGWGGPEPDAEGAERGPGPGFRGGHGPFGHGFGPGGHGPGFRGWGGPGPDAEGEWRGPQFHGGWGGGFRSGWDHPGHHDHHGHHGHPGRHGGPDIAWQIARLEQVQAFLEQRLADVKNALEHLRAQQQQQQQQDQPPAGTDRPTVHL